MANARPDQALLQGWLRDRNLARTDLFFLANEILDYKDINEAVHGPMRDTLQKFAGCIEYADPATGKLIASSPRIPLWELKRTLPVTNPEAEHGRRTLVLMPRGGLKTTTTLVWAMQWIINYPDVRILINTSTDARHKEFATEMLSHFRYNQKFRYLFPEFCPPSDRAADWGSLDYFNVPNKTVYRRAPTVMFVSVGKIIAGTHQEVVIHTDIVDKENVRTPDSNRKVIDHFRFCFPLVESSSIWPYTGWLHVEGTVYDFADLYSYLLEMKSSGHPQWQMWSVLLVDAEKNSQKKLSYWPSRYPWERLMTIKEEVGPQIYAANYRQKPVPEGVGLADKVIITPFLKYIKPMLPKMRLHCTVDLHGMEDNLGNDYTVMTVCGFLPNGEVKALDIRRGHFSPSDVIDLMFELDTTWQGKILDFKIEKDAHMRVLGPFLRREMERRERWLNIIPLKRDNSTSKYQRIKGLQSWFANAALSFSDQIVCLDEVILEIKQFPKGKHDDILDTLADQMQNRDGKINTDVIPAKKPDAVHAFGLPKFTGFNPVTHEAEWGETGGDEMSNQIPHNWQPWMKAGV